MAGSYDHRLVLPLGHYLGVSPAVLGRPYRNTVMVGGDPSPLTGTELTVWLASRGNRTAMLASRTKSLRPTGTPATPLMLGLGNRSEQPARYRIGSYAEPALQVTSLVYRMWEWSHVEASLWDGCRSHASVASRAGLGRAAGAGPGASPESVSGGPAAAAGIRCSLCG